MRKQIGFVLILIMCLSCSNDSIPESSNCTSYVNPFIGTGLSEETHGMMSNFTMGNTHPGPLVPWGMVTFAPRTQMVVADHYCGSDVLSDLPTGYMNGADSIYGFSQLLVSGSGCAGLGNVIVMPTTGEVEADFKLNRSTYSNEEASPGYYGVKLCDPDIGVKATVTPRTSLSQYIFTEETDSANIVIDLYHSMVAASDAYVKIVSDREIEGWCISGCFCNKGTSNKIHFTAQFDRPFTTYGTYTKDAVLQESVESSGKYSGAYLRFSAGPDSPLLMKTGISYLSIENARENLDTEQPSWDFQELLRGAKKNWEDELSKIMIEGGSEAENTIFYTALYHTLIHPNVINDVNGQYPAMGTKETRTLKGDRKNHYTIYSLWDTYRNLHPLLTLVYPERQLDMVRTMLDMYETGGFLPKWEIGADEGNIMVGDPACPVITDTYVKGVDDFDIQLAFEAMKKSSDLTENNLIRQGNGIYNEIGYIPFDHPDAAEVWGVAATTLEYNYADWAIAELARVLGEEEDHAKYLSRAMGYKKLYDPASSFLVPKNLDGSIIESFNIDTLRGSLPGDWESGGPGYVEGNAWQYNFFVPHDIPGLAAMMGEKHFVEKLQSTFDVPGRFMLFNEPDMAYPYLFDYIEGEGWRTQKEVSSAMKRYFNASASGLPGNDDCGTLSAWYIFSAIGFYPACPGSTQYQVGSPVFDQVKIALDPAFYPGKEIIFLSNNNTDEHCYIQDIMINGEEYEKQFIDHSDIVKGGKIIFNMGETPVTID